MKSKEDLLKLRSTLMGVVECVDEFINVVEREEKGEEIPQSEQERVIGKFMLKLMDLQNMK